MRIADGFFGNIIVTFIGFHRGTASRAAENFASIFDKKKIDDWSFIESESRVKAAKLGDGIPKIIEIQMYDNVKLSRDNAGISFAETRGFVEAYCNQWLMPSVSGPIIIVAPQFSFFKKLS